jgi:hypothetical protein
MHQLCISLKQRLERETVRHAGSLAVLVFYKGTMPLRCELVADGVRLERLPASEATVRDLAQGNAPLMPKDADYWRLMDNGGNVVMQGNGDG